jgi:DNA-binding IclR family transcriptional regulator
MSTTTDKRTRRAGTQSVERTVTILKGVCQRPRFGWQLADLASHCRLDKSTTHRILACLVREGVVSKRASDGHYFAGAMLFEFSLALPWLREFYELASVRLQRLAKRTGTVATLYLRSRDETVLALSRGEGITKNFLVVGDRMPLITTAGGLAILLSMPQVEARAVMRHNLISLARSGDRRVERFKAMYRGSKAAGMGIAEGQRLPGYVAYGLAVRDNALRPFAAVVLSGAAPDLPAPRVAQIVSMLREEIEFLSTRAGESA